MVYSLDLPVLMVHCLVHSRPSANACGGTVDVGPEMGSDTCSKMFSVTFGGTNWIPDSGSCSQAQVGKTQALRLGLTVIEGVWPPLLLSCGLEGRKGKVGGSLGPRA